MWILSPPDSQIVPLYSCQQVDSRLIKNKPVYDGVIISHTVKER